MADQHDEAGQISQILTPLGYRTEMTYDQAGRLVERIDPDGPVGATTTTRPDTLRQPQP